MDWFVSDTHFNHSNIIRYCNRPFATAAEMDEVLLRNINRCVKPDDTLWHLGDFCFGPRDPEGFIRTATHYRNQISCRKVILIHGNHDPDPNAWNREEREKGERFVKLFYEDYALRRTTIMGQKMTLCHYAMARWGKSHRGSINLYGHSHSDIEGWMESIMPGRRSLDVGVDNIAKLFGDYRPISFTELMQIMNSRPGFREHHGDRSDS